MAYYFIDLMVIGDPSHCFINDPPEGTDELTYRMSTGRKMGEDYPSDATVAVSPKYAGFHAPSIVGNTNSFLIVDTRVKEIVEDVCDTEIEYLPLTILDHRGKVSSSTHFIINPIGSVDCLDLDASDILYSGERILRVKRHVIDSERARAGGHLFRIKDDPRRYVITDVLAERLRAAGATNLVLIPVSETVSGTGT